MRLLRAGPATLVPLDTVIAIRRFSDQRRPALSLPRGTCAMFAGAFRRRWGGASFVYGNFCHAFTACFMMKASCTGKHDREGRIFLHVRTESSNLSIRKDRYLWNTLGCEGNLNNGETSRSVNSSHMLVSTKPRRYYRLAHEHRALWFRVPGMSWLTPMRDIEKSRGVGQIASLKQHTQQTSLSTSPSAAASCLWAYDTSYACTA